MKSNHSENNSAGFDGALLATGILSLVVFFTVFINIPWEWSMFMDDTLYNSWMPTSTNLFAAMKEEVMQYWGLGRFYPVKYLANLLKWRYLPNDPSVFRYFNYSIYLISIFFLVAASLRAAGEKNIARLKNLPIFFFLVGGAILHKPLLEIISLNPLGETWVCFFFALGSFCFFSPNALSRIFLARLFFLLVALSKEPAALVFFGAFVYHAFLFLNEKKKGQLLNAVIDAAIFCVLLAIAVTALRTGSFTKGAYFGSTPWGRYLYDFTYKLLRYGLWTSPFLLLFFAAKSKIFSLIKQKQIHFIASCLFFLSFAGSYLVFMAVQGRIAYQEVPGSIALLGLYSLLTAFLYFQGAMIPVLKKYGWLLLVLYSFSLFISVSRWERYVRGIVEPRRAVENVLKTNEGITILIPVGEIYGHIEKMLKGAKSKSQVFQIDDNLDPAKIRGKLIVFQFPIYMGDPNLQQMQKLESMAEGWEGTSITQSYHIYVGKKIFPAAK